MQHKIRSFTICLVICCASVKASCQLASEIPARYDSSYTDRMNTAVPKLFSDHPAEEKRIDKSKAVLVTVLPGLLPSASATVTTQQPFLNTKRKTIIKKKQLI